MAIVMDARMVLVVVNVESYFVLFIMIVLGIDIGFFRDWSQPGLLRESVVVNDRMNVTSECSVSTSDYVVVGRTATVRCRNERKRR